MNSELMVLTGTAAFIGLTHTLLGPDHYLPFIAMSKARNWSRVKTFWATVLCGIGHVASSVVLGVIGIAMGLSLQFLQDTESGRGEIAGWLLTSLGVVYLIWGIRQAIRNKPHSHVHVHPDGPEHVHEHSHHSEHLHPHERGKKNIVPWILFTIFVFGPCEALIPMLMWPAATQSIFGIAMVATVFGIVTIATMTVVVMLATEGLGFVPFKPLQRFSHALAGAVVLACGLAIQIGL